MKNEGKPKKGKITLSKHEKLIKKNVSQKKSREDQRNLVKNILKSVVKRKVHTINYQDSGHPRLLYANPRAKFSS